jgi:phospholipid transport system substrate-binding protein
MIANKAKRASLPQGEMVVIVQSVARVLMALLCFVLFSAPARAADDPAGFIVDLGTRAIAVLTSQRPDAERESQFRVLFREGFDVPAISRFVLGRYWATASEAQRQEFVRLFESFVVHAYSVRFSAFPGQTLTVRGSRVDGDHGAVVQSQIAGPSGGRPILVDWRVSRTDERYNITDIMVEGVSMALTERQEFASVIQRSGGDLESLLKLLREKTGQPKVGLAPLLPSQRAILREALGSLPPAA